MEVWKIMFLSKWVICMFRVHLPGCMKHAHFPNFLITMFQFQSTCSPGNHHQQSHLKQSTHGDPRPDSTHFQCSNAAMNDENRDWSCFNVKSHQTETSSQTWIYSIGLYIYIYIYAYTYMHPTSHQPGKQLVIRGPFITIRVKPITWSTKNVQPSSCNHGTWNRIPACFQKPFGSRNPCSSCIIVAGRLVHPKRRYQPKSDRV